LLSVNAFRASGAVFGGKLLCRFVRFPSWRAILINAVGQRRFATKASAIVGTGLSPRPLRPPASSVLLVIICVGDGERLPMNFVTEEC
jgi:hypothetical protein